MRTSDSIAQLAPALVAALAEIEGARKDSKNPHFKNDYASLESVIEASKQVLAAHKLGLIQFPGGVDAGRLGLETVFIHESGEWLTGEEAFQIILGKQDAQGVGSAVTYARRYAQMAALNIPAVDDDGEGAVAHTRQTQQRAQDIGHESVRIPAGVAKSSAQAKRDGDWERMTAEIAAARSSAELRQWAATNADQLAALPAKWKAEVRSEYEAKLADLKSEEQAMRESEAYGSAAA